MLNDLSIGTDTSRAFGEFVRSNQEAKTSLGKMEFTVQVRWFFNASHPFPLFSLLFSYLLTSLLPSLLPSLLLSSPLSSPLSSLLCPSLRSPILIDLTSNITYSIHSLCQVLTTGNWPTYKVMDINLPPMMQRCVQLFQQYYNMEVSTHGHGHVQSLLCAAL